MHLVRWFRQHPQAGDGALAVVLAAAGIAGLWWPELSEGGTRHPDALAAALLLAQSIPLTWRRVAPRAVLAVISAAVVLFDLRGYDDNLAGIALLVALATLTVQLPPRQAWQAGGVFLVVLAGGLTFGWAFTDENITVATYFGNFGVTTAALLTGDVIRRRRERMTELEERARVLEREQEREAERAVERERVRIARELHDVVAHSVTVMVVQAGAGRRIAATDPTQTAEVLAAIERTGRDALEELRRLVGVLRRDGDRGGPELAPQPTLANLDELTDADPHLAVDVTVEGEPYELAPSVDLSAYRIVQEALTNVRKHAGPARASVALRFRPDTLEIEVADDGRGATSVHDSNGHGLAGMRERAALCGGDVRAGPRRGGGWVVTARLPQPERRAPDRGGAGTDRMEVA